MSNGNTSDDPKLGDRVEDRISGIKGIVTGFHTWLYGCERVTIQPEEHKDGKPAETFCIDAAQCKVIRRAAIAGFFAQAKEKVFKPAGPSGAVDRGHSASR